MSRFEHGPSTVVLSDVVRCLNCAFVCICCIYLMLLQNDD